MTFHSLLGHGTPRVEYLFIANALEDMFFVSRPQNSPDCDGRVVNYMKIMFRFLTSWPPVSSPLIYFRKMAMMLMTKLFTRGKCFDKIGGADLRENNIHV